MASGCPALTFIAEKQESETEKQDCYMPSFLILLFKTSSHQTASFQNEFSFTYYIVQPPREVGELQALIIDSYALQNK